MRWARHLARMGDRNDVYRTWVWRKPEGKRVLRKPRRRWEDNFKKYIQEVRRCMVWITLAQDKDRQRAFTNELMKFRSHKMRGIFRPAEELLASQEEPFSMELVSFFYFKCFCFVKV